MFNVIEAAWDFLQILHPLHDVSLIGMITSNERFQEKCWRELGTNFQFEEDVI